MMTSVDQEVAMRRKVATADTAQEKTAWSISLRSLFSNRGQRPCQGSIFCIESSSHKCAAGAHDTCAVHVSCCASCGKRE
jgi:hypothetical protein